MIGLRLRQTDFRRFQVRFPIHPGQGLVVVCPGIVQGLFQNLGISSEIIESQIRLKFITRFVDFYQHRFSGLSRSHPIKFGWEGIIIQALLGYAQSLIGFRDFGQNIGFSTIDCILRLFHIHLKEIGVFQTSENLTF